MTDKISEFRRINEPRAMRMLEQLGHINKSAASMKVPGAEVRMMMTPVFAALDKLKDKPLVAEEQTIGRPIKEQLAELREIERLDRTPPIAREMETLADLSTQQLVDRMIACGAELARRRQ